MGMLISFWNVLAMMAPWLLTGFFLAGVASILLPREWVIKAMGHAKGWRGVLNATLIGVPLPICSCGVLPLTTGLRKAGAGKGAIAGFLISTPQTGIDSILATYALMGPIFAVARPLAAFTTGIVGGTIVNALTSDETGVTVPVKEHSHCNGCCHHEPSTPSFNILMRIFRAGYVELLGEVARPLTIGLIISAIATVIIPENFFVSAFGGNDWLSMPTMVLIGFPMYVCSTASIPIAASMMAKGLTPGAAFVFLMVGPAINAASLTTISKLIGAKATVVYALVIALGAIICGIAINLLPTDLIMGVMNTGEQESITWFEHTTAAVLIICLTTLGKTHYR